MDTREGKAVPNVTFRTREGDQWLDLTSNDIFSGKNVVVFSLPGAFTPTCSSTHLPRYNELAGCFKAEGIDQIVCVSVNDAFVMNAWKSQQDADNITVIPDGNGEFTAGMGMLVDKNDLGFGKRSWRYAMLVRDGIIEKMFIEPDQSGDPFEVSDADTMLKYLNPGAAKPQSIAVLTKPGCGYCTRVKAFLADQGLDFEEISLGTDATAVGLRAISGRETVPQVFVDGEHIGGSEETQAYFLGRIGKAA